jgi:hypothetical protein
VRGWHHWRLGHFASEVMVTAHGDQMHIQMLCPRQTGQHITVAAIVSGARQHDNARAVGQCFAQALEGRLPGALHQGIARRAGGNGATIQFTALVGGIKRRRGAWQSSSGIWLA